MSKTPKYHATIGGSSWSRGPEADFDTITDARDWAESYGTTADYCSIRNRKGVEVAAHKRSTEDNGMSWYRVNPSQYPY